MEDRVDGVPARPARSRAAIVGGIITGIVVVGMAGVGVYVHAGLGTIDSSADARDWLTDLGLPQGVSRCVTDRVQEGFYDDPDDPTLQREFLGHFLQCSGVPTESTRCYVDAMTDIVGDEAFGVDFVEAATNLDPAQRRELMRAGIECNGASRQLATCVVDAIADELGPDTFDDPAFAVIPEDQAQVDQIILDCAADEIVAADEAAVAPSASVVPVSTAPDTTDVAVDASGPCGTVATAFAELAGAHDSLDASGLAALLDTVGSHLDQAHDALDPAVRDEAAQIATMFTSLSSAYGSMAFAREAADPATVEIIDDVVAASTAFLRTFANADQLTAVAPNVAAVCNIDHGTTGFEALRFVAAIDAFVATDLGQQVEYEAVRAMAETMHEARDRFDAGPTSGLDGDYYECLVDGAAQVYGDNAGCDALHDACAAGNLLACNDLFWTSNGGSRYEAYAASCADRVDFGHPAFGGFCEEAERS